ncbi:MAG: efflux transporter outer membrane subunit [Herminiimonas sp.]|nr:efflux transporter outer membrane subunit [Herminiimonas sp.]
MSLPLPRFSNCRLLLAAAVAMSLSGCASFGGIAPHATLQPDDTRDTALSLPDQGGQWPAATWAAEFGGAPLQALVDEALAGNPSLQVAASRVAAAQAAANVVSGGALPAIGANFSATRQRYTENGIIPPPLAGQYETDAQLALNFRYDFDFWGKNGAALRSALSQRKLSQAEQYNARLVLTTAVARAWLQLGRNSTQLDLVTQQMQVRESLDKLTRQRLAAGLDSQSETQLSLQQAASLRAEQAQWQEQIALSRNQLAALLGRGPDRGLTIARPILPEPAQTRLPSSLPLTLIGRRPDIVAARWRVEAAQGQIDYARAQFYPNIDVMAFAGFSSLGLSNLLQSGSRVAGVGPAITLPVFEGGTLRARLSGQVATFEGAVASYNQSLNDALHDVADQVQSLRGADVQAASQQQATQAASRALKLAQERRRVGTINQLQLLASESMLLAQRRIEFDAQARRLDLRVGLIKALGGGFDATTDHLDIRASQPVPVSILPASGIPITPTKAAS